MSWIRCKCGESIPVGQIPNPYLHELVPDQAFDELEVGGDLFDVLHHFRSRSAEVYLCRSCGRLIVFWSEKATFYIPEPVADNDDKAV